MLIRSMLGVPGLGPASGQRCGGLGAGGTEGSAEHEALDALIRALIEECTQTRADKDWTRVDVLRDQLIQVEIAVVDGREGTSWRLG